MKDDARFIAYRAGGLASVCDMLGDALFRDPDTASIGEAIKTLGGVARTISNDILDLTEDDDSGEVK